MRFLTIAVAVSALALATGAFAQTAPRSAPPPVAAGEAQQAAPALGQRRQNSLQAMPDQCGTCRRPPRLSWLPYGMRRALLGLRNSSGSLAMFAANGLVAAACIIPFAFAWTYGGELHPLVSATRRPFRVEWDFAACPGTMCCSTFSATASPRL